MKWIKGGVGQKKGARSRLFFSSPQLLNKSERPPCIERSSTPRWLVRSGLHGVGIMYQRLGRFHRVWRRPTQQRGSRNFECISNAKRASHSSHIALSSCVCTLSIPHREGIKQEGKKKKIIGSRRSERSPGWCGVSFV